MTQETLDIQKKLLEYLSIMPNDRLNSRIQKEEIKVENMAWTNENALSIIEGLKKLNP